MKNEYDPSVSQNRLFSREEVLKHQLDQGRELLKNPVKFMKEFNKKPVQPIGFLGSLPLIKNDPK